MSVDLSIKMNFSLPIRGRLIEGAQGLFGDDDTADTAFIVSVDGEFVEKSSTLANATAVKIWDDDTELPDDIDFLFFVADVDMYLQVIGTTTNFIVYVTAGVPFVLSNNTMLAAADTVALATSATVPSVLEIDNVVIKNLSGGPGNYVFFCCD